MTGTGSSSAFAASEAESPSMQYPAPDSVNPSDDPCFTGRTEATEPFTDEEREAAAYRAGNAMLAWYSAYRETGNAAYLDNAYHALGLQKKLLAGRSAAFVARLERERGIA